MPDAYKCSKCGSLFEGKPEESFGLSVINEDVEICPRCLEEFVGWLEGHEINDLDNYAQEELDDGEA